MILLGIGVFGRESPVPVKLMLTWITDVETYMTIMMMMNRLNKWSSIIILKIALSGSVELGTGGSRNIFAHFNEVENACNIYVVLSRFTGHIRHAPHYT